MADLGVGSGMIGARLRRRHARPKSQAGADKYHVKLYIDVLDYPY